MAHHKKKSLSLTLIVALFISAVAGARFVNLGTASSGPPDTPSISILSPKPNGPYVEKNIAMLFEVKEPDSWITQDPLTWGRINWINYSLDGNEISNIPENVIPLVLNPQLTLNYSGALKELSEGEHNLTVSVSSTLSYKPEGSAWWEKPLVYTVINSSSVYFTTDTIRPTISILSLENKTYYGTSLPLDLTVSEPVSWIGYSFADVYWINNTLGEKVTPQANVTITGNTTLPELAYGAHILTVYANDTAGNIGVSETIYFSTEIGSLPTTWLAGAVVLMVAVDLGLLFSLRKRHR